jgi:hypothetical protein
MYGTSELIADRLCAELVAKNDGNRYRVQPHSWYPSGQPRTWGVARIVPYCDAMAYRFDGFVWFTGVL